MQVSKKRKHVSSDRLSNSDRENFTKTEKCNWGSGPDPEKINQSSLGPHPGRRWTRGTLVYEYNCKDIGARV